MRSHISWTDYEALLRKQGKSCPDSLQSQKQHKYRAKKVIIDDITFPSKLEGKWYVALQWQYKAGLITEPLRQVWFSLGEWLPLGAKKLKEYFYVADFVYVNLKTRQLIVADAKGYRTEEYRKKKDVFEQLYGVGITELGEKYR